MVRYSTQPLLAMRLMDAEEQEEVKRRALRAAEMQALGGIPTRQVGEPVFFQLLVCLLMIVLVLLPPPPPPPPNKKKKKKKTPKKKKNK